MSGRENQRGDPRGDRQRARAAQAGQNSSSTRQSGHSQSSHQTNDYGEGEYDDQEDEMRNFPSVHSHHSNDSRTSHASNLSSVSVKAVAKGLIESGASVAKNSPYIFTALAVITILVTTVLTQGSSLSLTKEVAHIVPTFTTHPQSEECKKYIWVVGDTRSTTKS
jgi:hypothetical protein